LEGISMVDESLLTGESTPVRKAPGDEVIGGSKIISDNLTARVTVNPEETYISPTIKMVESSKRPRTPNEVAVTMVLVGLTAIFLILFVPLLRPSITLNLATDLSVLLALYVCLLPTTIGALLPSIGLSGISRLYRRKIVAKSGRAVERAGDTDVIILDKTGTITVGNRQATEFIPFEGHTSKEVGEAAFLSSWHDDTPEGRSLIRLAYEDGFVPRELKALAVTKNREAIGLIRLRDVLKPDIREKIESVKVMGIRPVMLTGDQPLTAKSIANEVGIDEYRPEAKPEDKYEIVMREQSENRVVAMIGDGTNGAPALAAADVGLAMNSGTQAAKEAANMVDLESNPAKIIEVVMLGKQLLMTRGAVTTFSIANDVAKYFAIVPVMFASTLPQLKALNILGLGLSTAV